MKPRFSLLQCPDFQLASECAELCSCEKIFELRCGRWNSTHDLVATDARKHDAIPLRAQAQPDFRRSAAIVPGSRDKAAVERLVRLPGLRLFFGILWTDVDMPAGAATFFFDFGEIGAF